MWVPILVCYVLGLIATAMILLRAPTFERNHVLNGGMILMWPLYWSLFLVAALRNRR